MQIVYFDQSNSGGVVYTAYDRGVVARSQLCNDGRLGSIGWSVAAVLNISYLVPCDNPADYRMLPVIIGPNQCAGAVVQFQGRISQCIGNVIWSAPSSGPMARIITLFGPSLEQ